MEQKSRKWFSSKLLSLFLFSWLLFMAAVSQGLEARGASVIKIGLLEEPKTLNVWLATDTWSLKVLRQIYQPLYHREPKDLNLIPWLAAGEPVYDAVNLSYTVTIRPARWSDGSELTADDVVFTGNIIREFKIPRSYSQWEFVKKIEAVNKTTVRFFLEKPQAIFLTRTLLTPIVQKKEWEKIVSEARQGEKPLTSLLNHKIERPIGAGPFVFKEWKQGAYLFLEKNPHFFGQGQKIGGHTLGPFIDGMIFKTFGTSDAAILALKKGSIDMFWDGLEGGYLKDLSQEKSIRLYKNERSALYYLGFNLRKKPFNDIHFRHAVATMIDKDFIINRCLQGLADRMYSIIPAGNIFWHCPDLPRYGEGLTKEDRIRKAYEILMKAGYTWKVPPVKSDGAVDKGEGIILPDGTPMTKFTILTPPSDYDPHRAMTGMMVQEWLRWLGIPVVAKPMAFGSLVQQVKGQRDFDLFVLGYGQLSLDPDYLGSFFHSDDDKPSGWNMSGYHNPEYDRIADASAAAMDQGKRRELIWEMQRMIMRDIPYLPLYNPRLVEGVRTENFEGWVDMIEGIGNIWSFCQLKSK